MRYQLLDFRPYESFLGPDKLLLARLLDDGVCAGCRCHSFLPPRPVSFLSPVLSTGFGRLERTGPSESESDEFATPSVGLATVLVSFTGWCCSNSFTSQTGLSEGIKLVLLLFLGSFTFLFLPFLLLQFE